MKSVFPIAIVALFSISAAYAGSGVSYNLSDECTATQWQEAISSAPGNSLEAVTTLEYNDYAENPISVREPVVNLCIDGNYLRPITGAYFTSDNCPGPGGADQDVSCQIHWADPIKGYEWMHGPYYNDMDTDWSYSYRVLPTTYTVQVVDLSTDGDDIVCEKNYTIPSCSQVNQAK